MSDAEGCMFGACGADQGLIKKPFSLQDVRFGNPRASYTAPLIPIIYLGFLLAYRKKFPEWLMVTYLVHMA